MHSGHRHHAPIPGRKYQLKTNLQQGKPYIKVPENIMDYASLPNTRALDVLSSIPADKKIRLSGGTTTITTTTAAAGTAVAQAVAEAAPSSSPSSSSPAAAGERRYLDVLPGVVLREIVSFTTDSSLSGVCRTTLGAIRELHYKIDMNKVSSAHYLKRSELTNHMGLDASGALATGRAVVRITITHVLHAQDPALEQAIRRVVQHSIPTLREIAIRRYPTWNGRARVGAILGELVPLSAKRHRVAPRLARVHLVDGATGVAKAGRAVAAGLWPALEVLTFSHCRANAGHFRDLARGLRSGLAPRLRVLGVGAILGELVPLSAKRHRVAPRLARVHLVDGATGVAKAGRAVAAGLWPALEVLTFSHCRANAGHFRDLARGLRSGLAPRLRVLGWDDQSSVRDVAVDDVILGALSWGQCPLVERLSFTGNRFCPEHRIRYLEEMLWVCPRLRELRMDCSRTPHHQLSVLAGALAGGHVPRLERLLVRATARYYRDSDVELLALKRAAASRSPPVELELQIKTRLKQ
ncbi:hypothetical protein Esi_0311_0033 [Ectocarpus siliculosus]|uniref:Uncharacterized protein n=1 Tax=Ectocarpus siliculosus TaxID=2880 RepID=D7FWR9_ECTSI|nr:hypothetical protein Esi_0311_0033 [Ectocarpus siliculosus]|eukprot:CBJ32157.1 hypothetical protein Esi_0311_0033 [Ectocarpus siliculosus]